MTTLLVAWLPLACLLAGWVALTRMRAPLIEPARRMPPGQALMIDALDRIPARAFRMRIATSALDELGVEAVVLFGVTDPAEPTRWSRLDPVEDARPVDATAATTLAAVARGHELVVSPERLDVLVPLAAGAGGLVAGLRLARRDAASLAAVHRWRVQIGAALRAQHLRNGDQDSLVLANERAAARVLEAAAMASDVARPGQGVEWSMRVYGERARPHFLGTYTPTPTTTVIVFGRSIASGVASSLLNVAIKSCCDVLVNQMGPELSVSRLTRYLSRFLWRSRDPVGAHCHVLVVDRGAERAELVSAGSSTLVRMRPQGIGRSVTTARGDGVPLGTALDGGWGAVALEIAPGDVLLVATDIAGHVDLPPSTRFGQNAESILDEVERSAMWSDCLLAAVVR